MSFIYDIIYNTGYPFADIHRVDGLSCIKDIKIITRDTNTAAYLTDFILSKESCLISIKHGDTILSFTSSSPHADVIYPLTNDLGEYCGTIVFSNIQNTKIVNEAVAIDLRCNFNASRYSSGNIFGKYDETVNLTTAGSLIATVEEDVNNTTVYITTDDAQFIPDRSMTISTGEQLGFTTINGAYYPLGSVTLNIEGYTISSSGECGLEIAIASNGNLVRCGSATIFDNIRCSSEGGSSTPYPLDEFVCGDEIVCKPSWDK